CLASGAQWNYAPTWTEWAKDGWNGEDFNILDPSGATRPNYRPRPYPRLTAGWPLRFAFREAGAPCQESHLEYVWAHCPERGATPRFSPRLPSPPRAPPPRPPPPPPSASTPPHPGSSSPRPPPPKS